MRKIIYSLIGIIAFGISVNALARRNNDGSADMRYKQNQTEANYQQRQAEQQQKEEARRQAEQARQERYEAEQQRRREQEAARQQKQY